MCSDCIYCVVIASKLMYQLQKTMCAQGYDCSAMY